MKLLLALSLLIFSFSALAGLENVPACEGAQERLSFNNQQVLAWRNEGQHKFLSRAFIRGRIIDVIEEGHGHIHFAVDLDGNAATTQDHIEVIYNTEFGELPVFNKGDELIACGDYVTDSYSPLGGVVHWLHLNKKKNSNPHKDGFLIINGHITGLGSSPANY